MYVIAAKVADVVQRLSRGAGPGVTVIPDPPQHGGPIILMERVSHINEEKPPVLILQVLLPQQLHVMYPPLDTRINPSTDMFSSTGLLCLYSGNCKNALCRAVAPHLSNAHRKHPRPLIDPDQAPGHHGTIGSPGWVIVYQLIYDCSYNLPEVRSGFYVLEDPVL